MNKIKEFFKSINFKNIQPHTYVSIIMIVLVIINQILLSLGKPMIDCGEDAITYWVNIVFNIVGIVYPAWKNNSFTELAQYADSTLTALRDGKITKEELEAFIDENKKSE